MSGTTEFTFLSWNVRGLGDGVKRTALFSALKPYKSAIVCLQETRLQKDTIPLLKSRGYQTQLHSMHTAYSRCVSILISNDISFHLLQSRIDEQGRFFFLLCKLAEMLCIVVTVYVPLPFSPDSLKSLVQFIDPYSNLPLWVLEDFNYLLDRTLDKFTPPGGRSIGPGGPTPFARLISEIGLRDVRRDGHLDKLTFSCYSAAYRDLSRIDLCLCNSLAQIRVIMLPVVSWTARSSGYEYRSLG